MSDRYVAFAVGAAALAIAGALTTRPAVNVSLLLFFEQQTHIDHVSQSAGQGTIVTVRLSV
jgi:hypothetical protein